GHFWPSPYTTDRRSPPVCRCVPWLTKDNHGLPRATTTREKTEGRMSFLDKLFGRHDDHGADTMMVECPHKTLTARWDRAEDMGHHDRATAFHCEGCGTDFSGDEGRRLLL